MKVAIAQCARCGHSRKWHPKKTTHGWACRKPSSVNNDISPAAIEDIVRYRNRAYDKCFCRNWKEPA
jgi:hypothetical protein